MSDECLITQETVFPFYTQYQAVMRKFTLAKQAYTQWYDVAQQVMHSFLWPKQNRIYVSDFLERHASADQKRRKIDLVDYIQEST